MRHQKSIRARQLLKELKQNQKEVKETWTNIRKSQERVLEKAFRNPEISMLKAELSLP